MIYKNTRVSAFSLVELSIVLVIVGLMSAGVMVANSLIKSAKITSVLNEINNIKVAVSAFELEYNALPGDMSNAFEYFGSDCGLDGTSGNAGCNGNGDNCLSGISETCPPINNKYMGDIRRAFVHLSLSKIVPDIPYTIDSQDGNCEPRNISPTVMEDSTFVLFSNGNKKKVYMQLFKSGFTFATQCRYSNLIPSSGKASFSPEIAKRIDQKIDDENAISGVVQAYFSYVDSYDIFNTDCTDANGIYEVSDSSERCNLRIELR